MNTAFSFEEEPFEAYSELDEEQTEFDEEAFDAELADLEWEEEVRRGRRPPARTTTRRRQPGRLRRPVPSRPRPPKRYPPRRPVIVGSRIVHEPAPCVCPAHGTEFVRWVQSSLNQVLGLNLPVNGVMDTVTRSALRRFQEQQGLPVDGIAGPETERALIEAKTSQPSQAGEPPESGEFEDLDLGELEWEGEINRQSPEYARWVQSSLNQILGLRLAVDGKIGPQTRSAVRSFQQRQGLKADGIVGSRTEAALIASGAGNPPGTSPGGVIPLEPVVICGGKPFAVLDQFSFDRSSLRKDASKDHFAEVDAIAREIVARWLKSKPVSSVCLEGHTDDTGKRGYNIKLGEHRARAVKDALCRALVKRSAAAGRTDILGKMTFAITSMGEDDPATPSRTPAGRAKNRRVKVYLLTDQVPGERCTSPKQPVDTAWNLA